MTLDTHTIFMMIVLLTVASGVSLLVMAKMAFPEDVHKSMLIWGAAYLVQTAGWLLVGLRGYVPDFLSIVLGNTLVSVCQAEINQAIRVFDGGAARRRYFYSLVLAGALAYTVLALVPGSLHARIVFGSFGGALLLAMNGWQLIGHCQQPAEAVRAFLGSGFWLLAAIYVVRGTLSFSTAGQISSMQDDSPLQTAVFAGTAIGVVVISFCFLWMCAERVNHSLARMASTDSLTGLCNRRAIEQMTQAEINRARQSQRPLAFLLFDVDNFKEINDSYCHLAGDLALQVIGTVFKDHLRASEIVGRLGGDEFVVLLPDTSETTAQQIAVRLEDAVRDAVVQFDGISIRRSISYGIAMFSPDKPDLSQVIRIADRKLYAMKRERKTVTIPGRT
jgi:diguanylate cyclase (GGDEF)-like protein